MWHQDGTAFVDSDRAFTYSWAATALAPSVTTGTARSNRSNPLPAPNAVELRFQVRR